MLQPASIWTRQTIGEEVVAEDANQPGIGQVTLAIAADRRETSDRNIACWAAKRAVFDLEGASSACQIVQSLLARGEDGNVASGKTADGVVERLGQVFGEHPG